MENKQVNRIGIVLSGGLARGAIQLAFAKRIIEKITYDRLKILSASSIGSLNAYAISCKTIDKMIERYKTLDFDNTRMFSQYIKNKLFNKIFNAIEGPEMFVPTYVTGTKVVGLSTYYFYINKMERSEVRGALNVSMAFPFINGPHRSHMHALFIDGGATDNIPVYPTLYEDLDMVIILHCYPKYHPPVMAFDSKTIVVDIDVTLELDKKITSFSLSKNSFETMVDVGLREGAKVADFLFSDFDYNNIKGRCLQYINSNIDKRREKSGDGLMNFVDVLNSLFSIRGLEK